MLRPLLLALTALLFAAPAAQACIDQPLSKPFTPWLDFAHYQAAPETWTLDGAAVVPGGHPWSGGSESLSLPAGASALTAPVCITLVHPTLRFFVRGTGTLAVSVLTEGGLEVPVGVVLGTGAWAPSPVLPVVLNVLGEQDVRFRFTSATGSLRIDDVWIDPYSKG
ncbi:hypothetical protein C8N24_0762 [Solirubrobacter pauli]|uniref:Uncharacterized protein n=1 Tax=Solirubrobacter pauli TaxID=166793 RepID=A0A660L7C8_9ACTN|nr:hypothetical protein [Solirubrobacter pauli]RKQ90947.1 hypothetical protein C8N24_0762 [Solirubrobacter pauli]